MAGYGFRYDPMEFAKRNETLTGALVRKSLGMPAAECDAEILNERINYLLSEQDEDGSIGDTARQTASRLIELLDLGAPADGPELRWAAGAILQQSARAHPDDEAIGLDGHLAFGCVDALCRVGEAGSPQVTESLEFFAAHPERWTGDGCPWTPGAAMCALWQGRHAADVSDALTSGLQWVVDEMDEPGCIGCWDPWQFVRGASVMDHPLATRMLRKQVPMILRAQRPDGGWSDHWGDRTLTVLRALERHGMLDKLRQNPPLPPDWNVVREIAAPGETPTQLVWDGESLWVKDERTWEAIAVSPGDGKVVRRISLPERKSGMFALGLWDDSLSLTSGWGGARKLYKISPETGAVTGELDLHFMSEFVQTMVQVGDRLLIGDGADGRLYLLDPSDPDNRESIRLGGARPHPLTADDEGVWCVDVLAPIVTRTRLDGTLLEWYEKPFAVHHQSLGMAWDGEELWALDTTRRRICVVEPAVRPQERAAV